MKNIAQETDKNLVELSTFLVGDALCGMDILKILDCSISNFINLLWIKV